MRSIFQKCLPQKISPKRASWYFKSAYVLIRYVVTCIQYGCDMPKPAPKKIAEQGNDCDISILVTKKRQNEEEENEEKGKGLDLFFSVDMHRYLEF